MEWGAAEWIAAGMGVIALVSVVVTGISIWVNHSGDEKRLVHEKEMQTEQLAHAERVQNQRLSHERREAVKSLAAAAYVDAKEYLGVLRRAAVNSELPEDPAAAMAKTRETYHDLALITALGWSEPVRKAAAELGVALRQSSQRAEMLIEAISRGNGVVEAGKHWIDGEEVTITAAEAYRQALIEDDGGEES